jgi:hypothetical protein
MLSLGDINTETWASRLGVGRKSDDLALKKKTVTKSEELKTECSLAEPSKEGSGSKRAVLPMIMMMMISHYHSTTYSLSS